MGVEIIAEAAQGYEGIPRQAELLVRGAAKANADAIKFQIIYADELCTNNYRYRQLFEILEMSTEQWKTIADQAKAQRIRFYSDVFGEGSLAVARAIGSDGIKLHTTDFYNDRLIKSAFDSFERIFISIGGISIDELIQWMNRFKVQPSPNVCIMYGYQAEPTPIESNNLLRIETLRKLFPGFSIGFQDHIDGASPDVLDLSLMALPLGVSCLEKHITLDRILEIEDFQSAITGDTFSQFVAKVRRLEKALGSASLELTVSEQDYRAKVMKRVVARTAIHSGETLSYENIALKRFDSDQPASAFIYKESEVLGRKLRESVRPGEPIVAGMLQ